MSFPNGSPNSFLRRAKGARGRRRAEKFASEFRGTDILFGLEDFKFERFCRIGPPAFPSLLRILKAGKPIVLTERVQGLIMKMRTPKNLAAALYMLSNPESEYRHQACTVLGIWKEKSAVAKLVSILLDPDEPVELRRMALGELGGIGDHSATQALLSLLPPPDNPDAHCIAADMAAMGICIESLGELGGKSAIPRLREFLKSSSLCGVAAVALARLGDADSVPVMVALAQSARDSEYNAGAEALCIIRDLRGAKTLAGLLLRHAHLRNLSCRAMIIETLGELGDECAIPALAEVCKRDGMYESHIVSALAAIGKFRCSAAYSALAGLLYSLSDSSKFSLSAVAGEHVIPMGAPAVPFIVAGLGSKMWMRGANVLVRMGYGEAAAGFFRREMARCPEQRSECMQRIMHVREKMLKHGAGCAKAPPASLPGLSLQRFCAPRRTAVFHPVAKPRARMPSLA